MSNVLLFQLLKCEDFLCFSVLYHCKLNIFGLLLEQNKTFEGVALGTFSYFSLFADILYTKQSKKKINRLINNENNHVVETLHKTICIFCYEFAWQ